MFSAAFPVLRQAVRRLRHAPGYSFTVLAVLALGIGAVTAIFSVVYGVLLKPYGFEGRGELIVWRESVREYRDIAPLLPVSYRHFSNLAQHAPVLESAAILRPRTSSVGAAGEHPQVVSGLEVSEGFFRTLGVAPVQGRAFRTEEFVDGHASVAVLTAEAWRRFFPGHTFSPGTTLRVNGKAVTIAGVFPQAFRFPAVSIEAGVQTSNALPYSLLVPHVPSQSDKEDNEGDFNYFAIGRLRPGVSLGTAQAQLDGLERATAVAEHVATHPSVAVEPFGEEITGGVSRSLVLLLLAVGSVLLIGCVNLANLQLARSVGLQSEQALRAALGASRVRLIAESLAENILLAALGMLLALPIAEIALRAFVHLAPATLPRLQEVRLNLPVFGAALGLSLLTSLLCGFLPAWRAGRAEPLRAMQTSRSTGESRTSGRLRGSLLVAEIACSVVLLAVTGLLAQSSGRLLTSAKALSAEPVTLAQANLFTPEYGGKGDAEEDGTDAPSWARAGFSERAVTRLRALPGIDLVSVTSQVPLTGEVEVDGINRPDHPVSPGHMPLANLRMISPDYFSTLHIPIVAGRAFSLTDREKMRVAVLSESAARAAFPGENPIGHLITKWDRNYTIVGVAADVRLNDPRHNTLFFYLPFWDYPPFSPVFLLRGRSVSASEIRNAIWSVDPQVAVPTVLPLAAQTRESLAVERFQTLLVSAFGAAGLLLTMLGVYGAVGYSVNRRMREWGLRMALGSGRGQLVRKVLGEAGRPLLAALGLGVLGSLAAERWIRSLLYGGDAHAWAALLPALILLPAAVLLAALPAARRAANADPAAVLRME